MKFSVVTFTHEVFVEFLLHEYSSAQDLKNRIDLIPIRSGGTNTGAAIESLYTVVFNAAYGDRAGAPNVAVIVTDGKSNDNAQTIQQAAIAKNMGIHIITVGVGMTDMTELHDIASSPSTENVFPSTDFNHLFSVIDVIENKFKEECTGT
jgi:collagen type XII alpha